MLGVEAKVLLIEEAFQDWRRGNRCRGVELELRERGVQRTEHARALLKRTTAESAEEERLGAACVNEATVRRTAAREEEVV